MSSVAVRSGFLRVDKPVGPTSHDVVRRARKALGERRIGHAGTLDPFASGLLLLGVGPATRLTEYLGELEKEYEATVRLGTATTTCDPEGDVTTVSDGWRDLGSEALTREFAGLTGSVAQLPPRFSAKKVRGERAYRIARRGDDVELEPAQVTIHEIELVDWSPPDARIRVRCSTGTYIRAIARDLGEGLGVGAHLTELRRTRIGPFHVDDAVSPDRVDAEGTEVGGWLSPLEAMQHLPRLEVDAETATRLIHGQSPATGDVPGAEGLAEGAPTTIVSGGDLVCVGRVEGDRLRPSKVFAVLPDSSP